MVSIMAETLSIMVSIMTETLSIMVPIMAKTLSIMIPIMALKVSITVSIMVTHYRAGGWALKNRASQIVLKFQGSICGAPYCPYGSS